MLMHAVLLLVFLTLSVNQMKANPVPITAPTPNTSKHGDDETQILKYSNENIGANGYNFAFETSDGVSRMEMATIKNAGSISVEGTVSWTSPDGVQYTLNYVADEHGFQPQGTHLPVTPETAI